ncbi:probable 2-oxoacid dehydrogenase E1 component alpha subunit [Natronomonas pharaonis DSM 2160]|uniref:Probable 2-oxoacid dehydrogenase E1 component alpha subunit n=1 Tax=Natronomonas pharaonis (strain ATCC 35678 / DSM 2160 / CIP 103997 / JCM 8858 / NBRC 14720 / NCIMB 2260 / Gabara) TaxID=348780 RepID=A0A1U7EWA3_NATPD|nr:thiamine pyrophosphate-dependent dehydrogenase E1 component subunit alpha [Natronomonas pharaonis]CAI49362.1 probable 2-oxoacid dehydrogenase E1 component alpha subunit [Natronomonas pharaonis DSM 2160]
MDTADAIDAFAEGENLHRRLDADGQPLVDGYEPPLSDDRLRELHRDMRLARHFDERMVSLQRQGRIGTYAPLAGQEAAQFGSMYALDDDDWVSYQYREHGAVIDRGGLADYIRYWMGYESGNATLVEHNIAPLNISIAAHVPHAVGMAWAAKLRGDDRAVVCHFGDGATSEGDFHEGANIAGVFDVPAVFVCNNNQWAISVPQAAQTASDTFAAKAEAYGFPGVRVDGMDPLATYEVMDEALDRAKSDDERPTDAGTASRPSLVEAVQYRFGAHTTADDPSAYRTDEAVERWRRWDPLPRFEGFLREFGLLDDEAVSAVESDVEATVADAVDQAMAVEPDPDDLFADAYAELPDDIKSQRAYLQRLREEYGDKALREEH